MKISPLNIEAFLMGMALSQRASLSSCDSCGKLESDLTKIDFQGIETYVCHICSAKDY